MSSPTQPDSEKTSLEASRTNSWTESTVSRPTFQRRDSLASLSVARDASQRRNAGEPIWPKGWRPYTCLLGGFLLMFNSWGLVNTYGTYASYYKQHLLPNRDLMLFNLIGSTQSFVVLILSAVIGRFLDAGYVRELIILGTLLVSIGSFMLSIVNGDGGYNQGNYGLIWLTQGFVSGLGMACFFVSSSQVVATWFKYRKGLAIGIVASGASIAGLVYPMMAKPLMVTVGFNDSTRYVAAVTTVTCAIAIFIARPSPSHIIREPERWADFRVFVDTQAFRNAPFVWLCAAICFLFFGFYAVFFNLEEWAASTGLGYKDNIPGGIDDVDLDREVPKDAIRTFYLLSIMNATSTLGRVSSAYLCDHFGALNVHAVVTFVASLLVLLLWTMAKTTSAAIAFVVLFGVFSGAVIGLPPASVAYILGPDPIAQSRLGQWTGMMYSTSAVFALTGPVIAGHLITQFGGNYLTVQCWSGACLFLSAVCMSMAILFKHKKDSKRGRNYDRRSASCATSTAPVMRSRADSEKEDV
ncbi:hypothetical protein LTR37_003636 [Vermiconidia calcicola]|uniref:Uncharacterized protein n=1 Tax=Vermiconidia calcicola TaxID=1690605 RepID=A0ACC3NP18_9PEZI|nr:hypothetical protein LTR37_003636 [Vermiconidia calcicola]